VSVQKILFIFLNRVPCVGKEGGVLLTTGPQENEHVHEQFFNLKLNYLLVSEFTGRESLDRDMLKQLKSHILFAPHFVQVINYLA